LRIKMPIGKDAGDRQRMRNIRVAAFAKLPEVGFLRKVVGLGDAREVGGLEVAGNRARKFGEFRHGVIARAA
jgi:hypothetical protein